MSPSRVEDISGGTTRASVTAYDAAGRATKSSVAITGGDASDPSTPLVTDYTYETNGQPKKQVMGAKETTTAYDTWGRTKSYTDSSGLVSSTTYTVDGQVATMNDGLGVYAYTYDNAGMPTSVDVGLSAGPDVFTYSYDIFGNPVTIGYPNGTVATRTYDEIGVPTGLSYKNGTTALLSFSATVDVAGRTVANASTASSQAYSYDNLGRLTKVQDTRGGGCATRQYGFSVTSERTSKVSFAPAVADGGCQEATPAVSWSGTYDSANRIRNAGYAYDNLGRTRTTPAVDTAVGGQSALTNTYYPNDMVASMAQTVDNGAGGSVAKTMDYALDASGRIDSIISKTAGVESTRSLQRYSDGSDSPTSIRGSTNGGTNWTDTRYIVAPGVGMALNVTGSTQTLQLANLHGDIVASQANTAGSTTIASYNEADEYGNTITTTAGPGRYGYLGAHQRSSETLGGMSLMGVRVYNPLSGQFGSVDPVLAGGATRYAYPADPANSVDLTGAYEAGRYWWGGFKTYSGKYTNFVRIWLNKTILKKIRNGYLTTAAALAIVSRGLALCKHWVCQLASKATGLAGAIDAAVGLGIALLLENGYGIGMKVAFWRVTNKFAFAYAYRSSFAYSYGSG